MSIRFCIVTVCVFFKENAGPRRSSRAVRGKEIAKRVDAKDGKTLLNSKSPLEILASTAWDWFYEGSLKLVRTLSAGRQVSGKVHAQGGRVRQTCWNNNLRNPFFFYLFLYGVVSCQSPFQTWPHRLHYDTALRVLWTTLFFYRGTSFCSYK